MKSFTSLVITVLAAISTISTAAPHPNSNIHVRAAIPAPALIRRTMMVQGMEGAESHKHTRRHRTAAAKRRDGGNHAGFNRTSGAEGRNATGHGGHGKGLKNGTETGANSTETDSNASADTSDSDTDSGSDSDSTQTLITASTDKSLPAKLQGTVTGKATFYFQGGVAGSCGTVAEDSDKVVAVQEGVMQSSLCGKQVKITNSANKKSVTATIRDTCPGCSTVTSLDLSQGAFDAIGDEDTGVLDISWSII